MPVFHNILFALTNGLIQSRIIIIIIIKTFINESAYYIYIYLP